FQIQLRQKRTEGRGNPVLPQIPTIDQDILLSIPGIFLRTAAFLVEKDLAADLLRTVPVFPGGVFFHKRGVRYSSAPADTTDHLRRVFRIKERIFPDILIHTPSVLIFLAVIGKKDDLFPGIGKIIKKAGIICDQRTAQTESLIGIPLRRKGPDMSESVEIPASAEKRMEFDQQYFVIVKAFIPYPQMSVQNIHILPVIY